MYTIADTLAQIAPHLPGQLVSPGAFQRVRAVAGSLPAALTNSAYLECRLRDDDPQVDLIIRVDERGRAILAGANPAIALVEEVRAHPIWERLRVLARAWSMPRSPLHDVVACLWLEFDIDWRVTPSAPVPRLFVELTPAAYMDRSADRRLHGAVQALSPLMDRAISPPVLRSLRTCFERLPANACIPFLGIPLSRGADTVRACVTGLGDLALPVFLQSIGWTGSLDDLASIMAPLAEAQADPAHSVAVLNLDLSDGVFPRIGLEYLFDRRSQLVGCLAERRLLDHLVARELLSSSKRDGVLRWPGFSRTTMPHELWPSLITRRLNHVKLAFEAGQLLEAKGYLCVNHEFSRARRSIERPETRTQISMATPVSIE